MTNSLDELNGRFEKAQKRISKLENRSVDIIQSKEQKVKIMKN